MIYHPYHKHSFVQSSIINHKRYIQLSSINSNLNCQSLMLSSLIINTTIYRHYHQSASSITITISIRHGIYGRIMGSHPFT